MENKCLLMGDGFISLSFYGVYMLKQTKPVTNVRIGCHPISILFGIRATKLDGTAMLKDNFILERFLYRCETLRIISINSELTVSK